MGPEVWIWVLVEESDADADYLGMLKAIARDAVRETTGLWAYALRGSIYAGDSPRRREQLCARFGIDDRVAHSRQLLRL